MVAIVGAADVCSMAKLSASIRMTNRNSARCDRVEPCRSPVNRQENRLTETHSMVLGSSHHNWFCC